MKLLWISNAPGAPSGYGTQTAQAGRRIAQAGYEIEFVANDGSQGSRTWEGLRVRGSGRDMYSRDKIGEDLARSGADWVISLYDAWVYTTGWKDPFEGLKRIASWIPIDHFPVPLSLWPWLRNGHTAIAMSRFGQQWLGRLSEAWREDRCAPKDHRDCRGHGFPVLYAPHAIEESFVRTESAFRQQINVPGDAYLVGIVAANYGSLTYDRKGMSDMAHAVGMFMDDHPDAYVYVHSTVEGPGQMALEGLFGFKGVPSERLRFADQYRLQERDYSQDDMAAMYSAFDVLLATSRGEGFGIPVIEAQACGTPVIASNWTAQPELVGDVWDITQPTSLRTPSGWLVAVEPDYDPRHGADFGKPHLRSIIRALGEAYERRGDPALRDAALAKAAGYRADAVFDTHWRPILAAMAESLVVVPLNRAQRRKLALAR